MSKTKVNDKALMASLKKYEQVTRKEWAGVVKGSIRRYAENLSFRTQPYGADLNAQRKGFKAVQRDVSKVYTTISDVYDQASAVDPEMADVFYGLAINNKFKAAEKILKRISIPERNLPFKSFDRGAAHDRRFTGGRLKGSRIGSFIVRPTATKSLDKYIAKKQMMVGFAKSGWIAVASRFGRLSKTYPKWITKTKAKRGPATVRDMTKSKNPRAYGTNEVSYVSSVLSKSDMRAAAKREGKVAKDLAERASDAAAKKARLRR